MSIEIERETRSPDTGGTAAKPVRRQGKRVQPIVASAAAGGVAVPALRRVKTA